jgi:uncharacterized repeat protein (TIGR03803 family)
MISLQPPRTPSKLSHSTDHQFSLYKLVAAFIAMFLAAAAPLCAAGQEKILYSFSGDDGAWPLAGLIRDATGNLYGTTSGGGGFSTQRCNAYGCGTVFELTPGVNGTWTETVLYSFTGQADGSQPASNLIFDGDGNLYGTTVAGGSSTYPCDVGGCGVVFRLSRTANGEWKEEVLHSFTGLDDGNAPSSGLILDADGKLYGTTLQGGLDNVGVVFELSPKAGGGWQETVVHSFTNNGYGTDGAYPEGGLIFDGAGNLYGTTNEGGVFMYGSVFELKQRHEKGWTIHILHSFNDIYEYYGNPNPDGFYPYAGLIFDKAGNLYGTTSTGGHSGSGTVFRLKPGVEVEGEWEEEILYNFCSANECTDGGQPRGPLIFDAAGNLFGTTLVGGITNGVIGGGWGTVYELTPGSNGTWTETVLHTFNFEDEDGIWPYAGLIFGLDEKLYSTTAFGGASGSGCYDEGSAPSLRSFRRPDPMPAFREPITHSRPHASSILVALD